MAEHGIWRFDCVLSTLLISVGALASACSGDAGPSDPGSDADQDGDATRSDAARFDALSESRGDTAIDAATDVSLDVGIDLVDAQTDGPRDAVRDGAVDAPADLFDDRAPDAPDAPTADTGIADAVTDDAPDVADAHTVDASTADSGTADAGIADAVTADTHTVDAGGADTGTADTHTVDAGSADTGKADVGADGAHTADAPGIADAPSDAVEAAADVGAPNLIFVTSTTWLGNLGGLDGADAKCRERAQAAGLAGTFVALLSTSTVAARSRLGTARGWVRTDGRPFADRQQDLFGQSARTYYPPRVDEFGNTLPVDTPVMSGSTSDGTLDPDRNCKDWTTITDGGPAVADLTVGYASHGSYGYLSYAVTGCQGPHRLTCIEISRTSRVDPPAPPQNRRTAFVTNQMYLPPNGIGDADGLCAFEATAAGLAGTYKAFLATKQASAMSRFDLGGAPWVRVDGVVIAATASDFAAGNFLAPLNVMANGTHLGNWGVWVGSPGPSALGTSTCSDWSPTDPANDRGIITTAFSSSANWQWEYACNWTYGRVSCLQQ